MNEYLICKMLLIIACIFSATVLAYNLMEGWWKSIDFRLDDFLWGCYHDFKY